MDGHSRRPIAQGMLYLAAVGATFSLPFAAQAAVTDYECSFGTAPTGTGLLACPTGTWSAAGQTSTVAVQGYQSGSPDCAAGTTKCGASFNTGLNTSNVFTPIYAWNVCRWVYNPTGTSAFFVPFGSSTEWTAFNAYVPSGMTTTGCAVPTSVSGLPATTDIMSYSPRTLSNNYTLCNNYNTNTPTVWGRPSVSLWPATPTTIGAVGASTLTCNNGNTTLMAKVQWRAESEGAATQTVTPGVWTWERDFYYSPDIDLSTSLSGTTQVTIDWNIAPYVDGATISNCTLTSSPLTAHWTTGAVGTPSAAGMPRTGSKVMTLSSGQNYSFSLSCRESPGGTALTSVASASVATGWGGGCSEGCGSGGGGWG